MPPFKIGRKPDIIIDAQLNKEIIIITEKRYP